MENKTSKKNLLSCSILFISLVILSVIGYLFVSDDQKPEVAFVSDDRKLEVAGVAQTPREKSSIKIAKSVEKRSIKADEKEKAGAGKARELNWVDSTREALADPNVSARMNAILSLRDESSEEAVKVLSAFLNDTDMDVVSEAIDALGYIGLNSELKDLVYDLLEEKARDKDFPARGSALITAAMFGKHDRILPVISEYISRKDDKGNLFASRALSFVRGRPESIPYLQRLLRESENPEVHENALHLLSGIDTPEALALLKDHLLSPDRNDQHNTTWALSLKNKPEYNTILTEAVASRKLGKESLSVLARSPSAPRVFGEVLQRGNVEKEVKISLLKILAGNTINAPSEEIRSDVVSAVAPLLDSPDPDLEIEAIKTLGEVRGDLDVTIGIIAPKLKSDNSPVREAAIYAYAQYATI
ncbi:MAG: HEAT repeat domain-containing protein, partial [Desulfobulbaceae bacterium]|nr:HEAT repeat domain-containing protein [Desulfobulbaceae bacterium]